MSSISFRALTFATLLGASIGAQAANLMPNPDFDTNTSSWVVAADSPGTTFTLDATDGSPSVPSALLSPGGNEGDVDSACFAATAGQYDLFVNLKPGTTSSGAFASVATFSDTACSAPIVSLGNTAGTDVALPNGWFQQSSKNFTLPDITQSVYVRMGEYSHVPIHFDRVRFGPAGTTPVTLQSFDVN